MSEVFLRKLILSMVVAGCAFCLPAVEDMPSVRDFTDEDYEAGFGLAGIGTGEHFDFSAPPGAEVCEDWEAFGAAKDWFRCPLHGWSFELGSEVFNSITVLSYGTMRPAMTNLQTFVSPFEAPLGIVPVSNHGYLRQDSRPSRFWRYHTPSNTYVMTWQNVLLDRLVEKPVSFQAEMSSDGCVIFRYDLSRLPEAMVTNAVAGIVHKGYGRTFNRIPRNLTSLTWHWLDSRYRYVKSGRTIDSVMFALGDIDPLSHPGDGDLTAFENVFYFGDPNGSGKLPESDGGIGILRVTAEGSGRGELNIEGTVIPLLPGVPALRVALPRGAKLGMKYSGDDTVGYRLDSDDFCIGERAKGWMLGKGWIAFPYTEASHPCIHILENKMVTVCLSPGGDIKDLTCTWKGNANVEVNNLPPLSAEITPHFSRDACSEISYCLSHPDYICGRKEFTQVCEFCPKVHDEQSEDGSLYLVNEDYFEGEDDCAPTLFANICPIHKVKYVECEAKHMVNIEEAAKGEPYAGVLKLHYPNQDSDYQRILVEVPTGYCHCCSCPEHCTNYVAISERSRRLAVHAAGVPFARTTTNCTLEVIGARPSEEIDDATLSLCKTGVVYDVRNYTVFGVSITGYDKDLSIYNRLNPEFGLPVMVDTNICSAPILGFRADVDLPYGTIRLAITNAEARIKLVKERNNGPNEVILDSQTNPVVEMSLGEWKRLTKRDTLGRTRELKLLTYTHGRAEITLSYAAEVDGQYLYDEARQSITVVRPPLLPDYNRDGKIDDSDAKLACDRRFYFWTNKDCWKNDLAFSKSFYEQLKGLVYDTNGDDDQVNGRNDLVNQLPMAICTKGFLENWGRKNIEVVLMPSESQNSLRRCYGATSWDAVRSCVLEDIEIDDESSYWEFGYGSELHKAKLCKFNEGGDVLSTEVVRRSLNNKGMMYIEAFRECCNPITLLIRLDGETLFSYTPQIKFSNVEDMYRWHNIRSAADESAKVELESKPLPSPQGWPDSERDDANMYFVHGYNVSEREARTWGQAFFKRMWWSGMNAKFHVIAWFGNETQIGEKASPNYHVNVENAFASSKAFVDIVKKYPGRNYVAAHSLGNMLVSSAIQDWGLPYERYFMLNAAVAAEAYDASATTKETIHGMTPHSWDEVPNMYRSTHWYELEGFAPNDARRQLTWRNRFNRVNKAVNYYSSEEEVLQCDPSGGGKFVLQRDWAWYNQERIKGDNPVPGSRDEGGWAYNSKYREPETGGDPRNGITTSYHDPSVSDILAIKEDLRCHPVFKPFEDASLLTANFVSSITREMISQLLADAIPAESFPAGFNEVPKWNVNNAGAENINMAKELKSATEIYFWSHDKRWGHSYLLDAPYMVVHGLFEDMKGKMK